MIILPINAILQGQGYTRPEVDTALAAKQNTLTFDSAPTEDSTNPVTSGGVYTATALLRSVESSPTQGSTALITSGAVYNERLTAGTGIDITNGVISCTYGVAAGVSF